MKRITPGGTSSDMFAVPVNSTVLTPRVYLGASDVTSQCTITGPSKTNGTADTHEFYRVTWTLPETAAHMAVYAMLIDWRDPSTTLQPPLMFTVQVEAVVEIATA